LVYRTNVNTQLITSLDNGDLIKNQVYYSNSHFDLHTNFTFFLEDPVNGDEIRQKEVRDLFGYNGSYEHIGYIGRTKLTTEAGLNMRSDITHPSLLSHTKDRFITLNQIKSGDITQLSISPYLGETFSLTPDFSINAGLRFDHYYHRYNNKLASDSTLSGVGIYKANANILSPKLNFYYPFMKFNSFYIVIIYMCHVKIFIILVVNFFIYCPYNLL